MSNLPPSLASDVVKADLDLSKSSLEKRKKSKSINPFDLSTRRRKSDFVSSPAQDDRPSFLTESSSGAQRDESIGSVRNEVEKIEDAPHTRSNVSDNHEVISSPSHAGTEPKLPARLAFMPPPVAKPSFDPGIVTSQALRQEEAEYALHATKSSRNEPHETPEGRTAGEFSFLYDPLLTKESTTHEAEKLLDSVPAEIRAYESTLINSTDMQGTKRTKNRPLEDQLPLDSTAVQKVLNRPSSSSHHKSPGNLLNPDEYAIVGIEAQGGDIKSLLGSKQSSNRQEVMRLKQDFERKTKELAEKSGIPGLALSPVAVEQTDAIRNLLKPTKGLNEELLTLTDDDDVVYPTEMHALLAIVKEEDTIYRVIFKDIVDQVSTHMKQSGGLLNAIRERYAKLFQRIPVKLKSLHVELIAQRKLCKRLSEELMRCRETASNAIFELESVRRHDREMDRQATEAQQKLLSLLTQTDNTDDAQQEYHKLYQLQRDRLEEQLRNEEKEKKKWIDAATSLALRIAEEHGVLDLSELQKIEHARMRSATHVIVHISNYNDAQMTAVQEKIGEWRTKIVILSKMVTDEDVGNVVALKAIDQTMKTIRRLLDIGDPMAGDTSLIDPSKDPEIDLKNPDPWDTTESLRSFQTNDLKIIAHALNDWVDKVTTIAIRFTSDRDLVLEEDIKASRKLAESWIEIGRRFLERNEKTTHGRDFNQHSETLKKLIEANDNWLTKLDTRVSGEDGSAQGIIGLQNQLEDRCSVFNSRDFSKPLSAVERQQLRLVLDSWIGIIGNVIGILSATTEKEHNLVPQAVDRWMTLIADQINTDTENRSEENSKLHDAMMNWLVQLEIKKNTFDALSVEHHRLSTDLSSFCESLLKDAIELDMIADDKTDLRKTLLKYVEKWGNVSSKLLLKEKDSLRKVAAPLPKKKPTKENPDAASTGA